MTTKGYVTNEHYIDGMCPLCLTREKDERIGALIKAHDLRVTQRDEALAQAVRQTKDAIAAIEYAQRTVQERDEALTLLRECRTYLYGDGDEQTLQSLVARLDALLEKGGGA